MKKVNKYTFCEKGKQIYILETRKQISILWNMHIALPTYVDTSPGPTKTATKYYTSTWTTTLSMELPIHAETLNQFPQFPAHYVPCCTKPY